MSEDFYPEFSSQIFAGHKAFMTNHLGAETTLYCVVTLLFLKKRSSLSTLLYKNGAECIFFKNRHMASICNFGRVSVAYMFFLKFLQRNCSTESIKCCFSESFKM